MRVCVLEAGGDARAPAESERLPEDYEVPAFHPFASENRAMARNFFVEHYADPIRQARDSKRRESGLLYPRAGTLGGCTAHNAMIFVRPHDSDWDGIARLTGDASWRAHRMNRYFQRVEACRHRPLWRWIAATTGFNPTGHGWKGWLPIELALPKEAFGDDEIVAVIAQAARAFWRAEGGWIDGLMGSLVWALDPNNHVMVGRRVAGVFATPLSTDRGARHGTRERLREGRPKLPGSAPHRAGRPGNPRRPGRRRACHRCRIPKGGKPLRRLRRGQRASGRTPDRAGRAGGDYRRRHLQHAPASHAVGHRSCRRARAARDRRAGRPSRCRAKPPGPLRGRHRQPDDASVAEPRRGPVLQGRPAVSGVGGEACRHVHVERRGDRLHAPLGGARAGARP